MNVVVIKKKVQTALRRRFFLHMARRDEAYEIMTQAWGAVYDERGGGDDSSMEQRQTALERLLAVEDPVERREQMRDVYSFLHAQQLVHIASRLKYLVEKIESIESTKCPSAAPTRFGGCCFLLMFVGITGIAGTAATLWYRKNYR